MFWGVFLVLCGFLRFLGYFGVFCCGCVIAAFLGYFGGFWVIFGVFLVVLGTFEVVWGFSGCQGPSGCGFSGFVAPGFWVCRRW